MVESATKPDQGTPSPAGAAETKPEHVSDVDPAISEAADVIYADEPAEPAADEKVEGKGAEAKVETKPEDKKPDAKPDAKGETKPPAGETKPADGETKKPEGETKPADAETKPVVPEKYDLAVPDGSLLDSGAKKAIEAEAKRLGLTNEQAQGLLEGQSTAVKTFAQSQEDLVKANMKGWVDDVKADKELGGEKFDDSIMLAQSVIRDHADPEFKKVLDDTGFGSHPELVRMLVRIGRKTNPQKLVLGAQSAGEPMSDEDVIYGPDPQ